MSSNIKSFVLMMAVMVGLVAMSGSASAQGIYNPVDDTYVIGDGQTKVDLSQAFWQKVVTTNKISLGSIGASSLKSQSYRFPAVAGALDRVTVQGEINHGGGFFLQKNNIRVSVVSLTIDLTASPAVLTGLVIVSTNYDQTNTGTVVARLPLAELTLPATMNPPIKEEAFKTLYKQDIVAKMTDVLAGNLNSIFSTTSFAGGDSIGSISFFLVGVPSREHVVEDFIFRY
jgi:hypothetical protein